jgi:predicted chitinase
MSNGYGRSTEGFGISREQSVNLIVKTALENGVSDPKQIAYMLATAQHETRNFNAPEEDFGRAQARKLGYRGGEEYFGRGYVHLTHNDNYQKFDKLLGMNGELTRNPDLAKDPEIAAKVLVVGMRDGLFTGKKLDRYIDEDSHDLYNARRTVNGVTPKSPWSLKAAKECERYAEAWEKLVPGLIENVKKDGVDLQSETGTKAHTPAAATPVAPAVLKLHAQGAEVWGLQNTLHGLGYTGADGQPLKADRDFGHNTDHAVRAFQRAHGLEPVDGKVGSDTRTALAQAAQHPLVSETTHPNHGLYAAIGAQLPAGTRPEVIANVTLQAMENGITSEQKLTRMAVSGSDAYLMGTIPGDRAKVDLTAPMPDLQAISDHMREQTQQQAQQQRNQSQAISI